MTELLRRLQLAEDQSGQAVVEAAVVLPTFLLLFFGILAFATVMFGWCNITFASRAAVRYASIHSNSSLVPATTVSVVAIVTPFLWATDPTGTSTTVSYTPSNIIGSRVTVAVTAKFGVTMPFTSYTSFSITSTAQRTITR